MKDLLSFLIGAVTFMASALLFSSRSVEGHYIKDEFLFLSAVISIVLGVISSLVLNDPINRFLMKRLDKYEPNWRNDLAKCKFCDYKDPDINLCLNGNGFVSSDGICDNFVLKEKILKEKLSRHSSKFTSNRGEENEEIR